MANIKDRKILNGAILGVVLAGVVGTFLLSEQQARRQEYTGEIEEVFRRRDWLRGFRDPLGAHEYRYYRHYWRIRDDSGETRTVRVHHLLWNRGEPGMPVRKVAGERSPRIDTPEEDSRRELQDQLMHEVVDGVQRRFRE